MESNAIICLCMSVLENEILDLLKNGKAKTTSDIQNELFAGSICGKCLPIINNVVNRFNS